MIVEFGHFAAILALLSSLSVVALGLRPRMAFDAALSAEIGFWSKANFLLITLAFLSLIAAYIESDFTVINVIENSHTLKPLLYKISGAWGNHEGSILLWVWVLSLYGAAVAWLQPEDKEKIIILSVQAGIAFVFLSFMLLTSNPFWRTLPPAIEGQDLNPVLQDPGLAFHPPLLYLGYVGFSMAFAFAAAALIYTEKAAAIAAAMRPWAIIAWSFLTLGIALGSYWAYYELGWGGWWFWDPVENASLMPWLLGTALVHSVIVGKRGALLGWTLLLSLLTFCFSLLGTFLVRSGIITSVHSFANDPSRGVFLLLMIGAAVIASLILFAVRAPKLHRRLEYTALSREMAILTNSLFLCVLCATVFLGTLYPLFLELGTGKKISIGAPYFNMTFVPLAIPLIVIMGLSSFLKWGDTPARGFSRETVKTVGLTLFAGAAIWALARQQPVLGVAGLSLSAFLIIASARGWYRSYKIQPPMRSITEKLRAIPISNHAMGISHLGMGLTIAGLMAAGIWQIDDTVRLKPGDITALGPWQVKLEKIQEGAEKNYAFIRAELLILEQAQQTAQLYPEKRFFPSQAVTTTEASRHVTLLGDFYTSLGDVAADKSSAVLRVSYKPLVGWIWIGALFMAFGGLLSGFSQLRYVRPTYVPIFTAPGAKARIGLIIAGAIAVYLWLGAPVFFLLKAGF